MTRRATAARVLRRCLAALPVVLSGLFALGTPPAHAQTGGPVLSPRTATVFESDGEVVLTLSISWARPARVKYQTVDGEAKAPVDYREVSGEVVLANGDSVKIRIPIVDDDLPEDDETFTVTALEDSSSVDGWPWGVATVRILDDDHAVEGGAPTAATRTAFEEGPAASTAGSSTTLTPGNGQFDGSAGAVRSEPATTTTTPRPLSAGEVAAPAGEMRPGPGFELTGAGAVEPPPDRRGAAGSPADAISIGSGAAALGVGAFAVVRRRRRWSPTQA